MSNDIARAIEHVDQVLVDVLNRGLCRRPTPRPNEKLAAVYLAEQLERRGYEVELQDVVENPPNVVAILRGNPEFQSCLLNGTSITRTLPANGVTIRPIRGSRKA